MIPPIPATVTLPGDIERGHIDAAWTQYHERLQRDGTADLTQIIADVLGNAKGDSRRVSLYRYLRACLAALK